MTWHRHHWAIVSVVHVTVADTTSIALKVPGQSFTRYLSRCEVCGKVKSDRLAGTWSLEELRG